MKYVISLFLAFLLFSCKQRAVQSETKNDHNQVKETLTGPKKHFADMEAKALKEAYKGIITESGKIENLFPITSTGISTLKIQNAASLFLKSLTSEQKKKTAFDINDDEWRKWCNVDNEIYDRQGISLKEMSEKQKETAYGLMEVSLSAKGLQLSKDIMKTDQTLHEIKNGNPFYDEELYFFTLMGKPSKTKPWGWQLDGHHLVINYFVLRDQIVMSPVFMGGEPIITTTGKHKGNILFQDEQNLGLSLMHSLSSEQQNEAIISSTKNRNNNRTEANKDNVELNYQGVSVSNFTENQKEQLLVLISQYINNIKEGHSTVKLDEIKTHINETWFSWVGTTSEDAIFYYRIHSPVILIEFDHQKPVGIPNRDRSPTRNHIHTVVRTPNGNDYGKDLLKQHKENHH